MSPRQKPGCPLAEQTSPQKRFIDATEKRKSSHKKAGFGLPWNDVGRVSGDPHSLTATTRGEQCCLLQYPRPHHSLLSANACPRPLVCLTSLGPVSNPVCDPQVSAADLTSRAKGWPITHPARMSTVTAKPMENGARGPCVFSLMAPMHTARASSVVRMNSATTAPTTCPDSWTVTKAAPDAFQNLSSGLTAYGEQELTQCGQGAGWELRGGGLKRMPPTLRAVTGSVQSAPVFTVWPSEGPWTSLSFLSLICKMGSPSSSCRHYGPEA